MDEAPTTNHNKAKSRFEISLSESVAVIEYRISGTKMLIHHTFVSQTLRGKGIAGILTKAALEFAEQEGLNVVPECSYVAAYMKRISDRS